MASEAVQAALANRYRTTTQAVRSRVVQFVTQLWVGLESWRDEDIERFVLQVVPVVEAGQVQVAALTDSYLAAVLADMTGAPARVLGIPREVATGARGVPALEVYSRPATAMRTALAEGKPLDVAVDYGAQRARQLAETDIQLAKTHASREVLSRSTRVVGYRRVLTGSESCALCAIASTQRYTKERLMPIHPGCDCSVRPIVGTRDPGQVINQDLLDNLQDRLGDRFGLDARKSATTGKRTGEGDWDDYRQLVVTHEHGELGPVLARKGDTFTGPADVKPTKPFRPNTGGRAANAGDLTLAQGDQIADAARRLSRGDITRREYLAIVRRIRTDIEG